MKNKVIGPVIAAALVAAAAGVVGNGLDNTNENGSGAIIDTTAISTPSAYADMDHSGDWSEGDLALRSDGNDGYYLPFQ